jgi:hypothetical protein
MSSAAGARKNTKRKPAPAAKPKVTSKKGKKPSPTIVVKAFETEYGEAMFGAQGQRHHR